MENWICPVCGTEVSGTQICQNCGFDDSTNAEKYPTLTSDMAVKPVSVLKREWTAMQEGYLKCPACGGFRFAVDIRGRKVVCEKCRETQPLLDVLKKAGLSLSDGREAAARPERAPEPPKPDWTAQDDPDAAKLVGGLRDIAKRLKSALTAYRPLPEEVGFTDGMWRVCSMMEEALRDVAG